MDEKLRVIERNLAALDAVKDYDKLRIVREAPEAENPATTIDTCHLAVEERWLFQGYRRSWSGDGHHLTIAFIKHIISEARVVANSAFCAQQQAPRMLLADTTVQKNLFEKSPLQVLQELSLAIDGARKGLRRLRQTTYVDSKQIGVDLEGIDRDMDKITTSINSFLVVSK